MTCDMAFIVGCVVGVFGYFAGLGVTMKWLEMGDSHD